MTNGIIPAAQYLRMSTEHQQYSTANQSTVIARYAVEHGLEIVRSYTDEARSGVVLSRREGLKQLLRDVVQTNAPFRVVLVYDVSRWGRFQDCDEAAHYEFLCKSAGVPVRYCAEQFENDGTISSSIMKALKRSMAAEYSRELGVKVLAGQKRLAQLGFKLGGHPGFGLRRMLVSSTGERKQLLATGERKSIATDRVILVLGPQAEVECVRRIYRMFVEDGVSVGDIARSLNRAGVFPRWNYQTVHKVLTHPKYAEIYVFGQRSSKLYTPAIKVPRSEWVSAPGAIEPIIDRAVFECAQKALCARTFNKSDTDLLDDLRRLLRTEGRLTLQLINSARGLASPSAYRYRFGSLGRAYQLIGYDRPETFGPMEQRSRTLYIRRQVVSTAVSKSRGAIVAVRRCGRWREVLQTRQGTTISVNVARCVRRRGGSRRWNVDPHPTESEVTALLVRLVEGNESILDMRLFSRIGRKTRMPLTGNDPRLQSGRKLRSLSQLMRAIADVNRDESRFELK